MERKEVKAGTSLKVPLKDGSFWGKMCRTLKNNALDGSVFFFFRWESQTANKV